MDRMNSMIPRASIICFAVLLAALVTGCPSGLIDDITGVPFSVGNGTLTSPATSSLDIGDVGNSNKGMGQLINLGFSYIPTSFTVYMHATKVFKSPPGTGSPVGVTLSLAVWNKASGALLASSSKAIAAGYNGSIAFEISGAPAIPASTEVIYGVYLAGAVTADTQGALQHFTAQTYTDGAEWNPNSSTDENITNYAFTWQHDSAYGTNDLKFLLSGTEQ